MTLIELQNLIHEQNKSVGWWDEKRDFDTFVCLFHSELSEAMEGDRKGLMDDHLPQYEMFWVELADFVIRCMDWLGSKEYGGDDYPHDSDTHPNVTNPQLLAELHFKVSEAYSSNNDGFWSDRDESIADAVEFSFSFARMREFDLYQVILEKVEYNKYRADHKRENRAKEGEESLKPLSYHPKLEYLVIKLMEMKIGDASTLDELLTCIRSTRQLIKKELLEAL
ncbi:hypothetical protein [Vibrio phage LP.2]|nr:hypothetical protein [Vibrio phage LP.2]